MPTVPPGFEPLVREHIRRVSGKDRGYLTADEFDAGQGVRLRFADGSFAYFEFAFFIEDPERELVAVFTEHCGYHVFSSVELRIDTVRSVARGRWIGE